MSWFERMADSQRALTREVMSGLVNGESDRTLCAVMDRGDLLTEILTATKVAYIVAYEADFNSPSD